MRQLLTSKGLINISGAIKTKFSFGEFSPTYLSIVHPTPSHALSYEWYNIRLKEDYIFKTKQESINFLKSEDKLACFLRGELGYGVTFDLTPYEHEDNFN